MKAGLEVHQQLATGKLFCDCPTELTEEVTDRFARRLRAAGGENHAVDAAAAFQAARGLEYHYESGPANCQVEMDEEPPHPLNPEALDAALTLALLVGARPVDEVEVMRKIVVDGSNTTGFQRTALVATGGTVEVNGRTHRIETICLEEDSARRIGDGGAAVTYRLDRLGIPLVEVATAPDIVDAADARAVAEEIGALLRATGRVRRGIGTIREDLNVSSEGGQRIEIKGVQELRLIHEYVAREVGRQDVLLGVRDALAARGARAPETPALDLSEFLGGIASGPMAAVGRGHRVLALPLPGFAGLLRSPAGTEERLGREFADQARADGLKGLLHSDELPGYGIPAEVVDRLRGTLGLGTEDAFVLVVGPDPARLRTVLRRVRARADAAIRGIPGETRDPLPDGRTRYSRPLPGRDRMYPETDVPPVSIHDERLEALRRQLPERPSARRERFVRELGVSFEIARRLVTGDEADDFEELIRGGTPAPAAARWLIQDRPAATAAASPDAVPLDQGQVTELLAAVEAGRFAKEGIPTVAACMMIPGTTLNDAIRRAGLNADQGPDLAEIVHRVVSQNEVLLRTRGEAAFSGLMGDVMREARGRFDGGLVARVLREEIRRRLAPSTG